MEQQYVNNRSNFQVENDQIVVFCLLRLNFGFNEIPT